MQERRHARVHEADLGAWKQRGVGWGEGHTATLRVVCLSVHGMRAGSLWEGGGGEGPFLLSEAGVGGIVFVQ